MPSVQLYDDILKELPEFGSFDTYDRDDYLETGISPLGQVGHWLNELVSNGVGDELLSRVGGFLVKIYGRSSTYRRDIVNDFGVYLFWALEYPTLTRLKPFLSPEIVEDARVYLNAIDGENYRDF